MSTLLSVLLGVGLSAACGFRIFVPFLLVGIAARTGHLVLGPSFGWMSSTPALVAFCAATVLEVAAYYIPWLDHLLDVIASPAAAHLSCVRATAAAICSRIAGDAYSSS